MGLVKYIPNNNLYTEYYQSGEGFKGDIFQKGYGFYSNNFQRGYGIGGSIKSKIRNLQIISKLKPIIKNVLQRSMPTLKKMGKRVGEHILDAGKETIEDLMANKKSGQIISKQKENLKRKMLEVAKDTMHGRGKRIRFQTSESDSESEADNAYKFDKLIFNKSLRTKKSGSSSKLSKKKQINQYNQEPVDIFGQAWH